MQVQVLSKIINVGRYGHITSNIAESFNAAILEARGKPILGMYKHMRHHLMNWFAHRRKIDNDVAEGQIIVSSALSKIQELTAFQARRYRMIDVSRDNVFEVLSLNSNKTYTVKLEFTTCTCFEWQSTGIPCSHAIAAILYKKEDPQTYTQAFFSLDGFRRSYGNVILGPDADIADMQPTFDDDSENLENQDTDALAPPHARKAAGRPRVRRIRSGTEGPFGTKRAYRCKRCREFGHSKATCDSAI